MQGYTVDPMSGNVDKCFAVIYTPRKKRDRFPENCVTVFDTEHEAILAANEDEKKYAAIVVGPARSSEGFRMFYLVEWL